MNASDAVGEAIFFLFMLCWLGLLLPGGIFFYLFYKSRNKRL